MHAHLKVVTLAAALRAKMASFRAKVMLDCVKVCLAPDKVIVCLLLTLIWVASTAPFFIFYSTTPYLPDTEVRPRYCMLEYAYTYISRCS